MIIHDDEDMITWRVPCFCYDKRHDWTFEVSYDKKVNDVVMYVYGDVYTKSYSYHRNWFLERLRDFSNRVRIAFRVLVLGYVEYEMDLGFTGEEQIRDVAKLLLTTIVKVRKSGRDYGEPDPKIFEEGNIGRADRC